MHAQNFINIKKYPLDQLESPKTQKLIQAWHDQFNQDGLLVLDDFIHAEAVEKILKECEQLLPLAYHNTVYGNCYLDEGDTHFPEDHPRNKKDRTALAVIAYDQIPQKNPLQVIYHWPQLTRFVAGIAGYPTLYHYACPLGAINIAVMKEDDCLRWHFDLSDFVVAIPLQHPEAGGEYQYVRNIRQEGQPNYDAVKKILDGSHEGIETLHANPGSLVFFQGRYTLHRVTPIKGKTIRLNALLAYVDKPGVTSSEYLRQIRYGRVC